MSATHAQGCRYPTLRATYDVGAPRHADMVLFTVWLANRRSILQRKRTVSHLAVGRHGDARHRQAVGGTGGIDGRAGDLVLGRHRDPGDGGVLGHDAQLIGVAAHHHAGTGQGLRAIVPAFVTDLQDALRNMARGAEQEGPRQQRTHRQHLAAGAGHLDGKGVGEGFHHGAVPEVVGDIAVGLRQAELRHRDGYGLRRILPVVEAQHIAALAVGPIVGGQPDARHRLVEEIHRP